jgi:hypothetical protein
LFRYNHVSIYSGVSAEGSGVIVEGSAPITEEAVATPPAADSKVCLIVSMFSHNVFVKLCIGEISYECVCFVGCCG